MAAKKKTDSDEPKKTSLYTLELDDEQVAKLGDYCESQLWEDATPQYAQYGYKHAPTKVTLVAYQKKNKQGLRKLVISGKGTEDFVRDVIEPQITGEPRLGYDEVHHPEWFEPHAGMDEAGKGDLFGPVVACTAIATTEAVQEFLKIGVADSKTRSDPVIMRLDKEIRKMKNVTVQVAFCTMERYNELMARPQANLNKLLAWLHARALENALSKRSVSWGLLDQFSKQPLVQKQLVKDGYEFDLQMRTKAESDPIVAAASICARAEYLRQLKLLSDKLGRELPKGSGTPAKKCAIQIVSEQGDASLGEYAKLHFKTSYEARGLPVPERPKWSF
jgi:ribonuclease HIII